MSEKCVRCGSVGEDRRILWMACLYNMNEMGVPFEITKMEDGGHLYKYYTLNVCKRCRCEWMEAIKEWFFSEPHSEDDDADEPVESDIGSGIFVRRNGHNVEITEEEWYKMNPGREPVRIRKDN